MVLTRTLYHLYHFSSGVMYVYLSVVWYVAGSYIGVDDSSDALSQKI